MERLATRKRPLTADKALASIAERGLQRKQRYKSIAATLPTRSNRRARKLASAHQSGYVRVESASRVSEPLRSSRAAARSSKANRIARNARNQNLYHMHSPAFMQTPMRPKLSRSRTSVVPTIDPALKIDAPCYYFTKYGYCLRGEECFYLHKPELITICDAFIKGRCITNTCPLRHETEYSRLPVCHHFLQSNCLDAQCPYPHCAHAPNAPICIEFQRGNCDLEQECLSIHSYVCAEFYASGGTSCPTQTRCPYQHPTGIEPISNTTASLQTSQRARAGPQVPCKYMQRGACARGDTCFYSHDYQILFPNQEQGNFTRMKTRDPAAYTKVEQTMTMSTVESSDELEEVDTSREGRDADISDFEVLREHYKPQGFVTVVIKREKVDH